MIPPHRAFNFAWIPAVIYGGAGLGVVFMVARETVQRWRRASRVIRAVQEEQRQIELLERLYEEPAQGGPEGTGK